MGSCPPKTGAGLRPAVGKNVRDGSAADGKRETVLRLAYANLVLLLYTLLVGCQAFFCEKFVRTKRAPRKGVHCKKYFAKGHCRARQNRGRGRRENGQKESGKKRGWSSDASAVPKMTKEERERNGNKKTNSKRRTGKGWQQRKCRRSPGGPFVTWAAAACALLTKACGVFSARRLCTLGGGYDIIPPKGPSVGPAGAGWFGCIGCRGRSNVPVARRPWPAGRVVLPGGRACRTVRPLGGPMRLRRSRAWARKTLALKKHFQQNRFQ